MSLDLAALAACNIAFLRLAAYVVRIEVRYTRKEAKILKVPFFDLFKMNGAPVSGYMICIDVSQLYA